MSRLIGLSGAQGAGKSTLLKALMARGWALDTFRVSRAVQAELGWSSLDSVMSSFDTMVDFQERVFVQKYKNDLRLHSSPEPIVLTERTFADICAYTQLWTWRFIDNGGVPHSTGVDFLLEFTRLCASAHSEVYNGTMLLPFMSSVTWENDEHRADFADIDQVFADIQRFLELKVPIDHRRLNIVSSSVDGRVAEVEEFLRSF